MKHTPVAVALSALAVSVPTAVWGDASAIPELGPIDTTPPWALLGVTQDRRSLYVASQFQTPTCQKARADVLESDETHVRLRVVFYSSPGVTSPCPQLDLDKAPTVLKVPIGRKLSGQEVLGDGRVAARKVLQRLSRPASDGEPGVQETFPIVGLGLEDGLDSLKGFQIRSRHIVVQGPRSGYVKSVSPAIPKVRRTDSPVTYTVRTRAPQSP